MWGEGEIPKRWDMESIIICYLGRERLSDGEIGRTFFCFFWVFFVEFCFEGKLITKTAPKHYLKI
jgi:hypothetical protein